MGIFNKKVVEERTYNATIASFLSKNNYYVNKDTALAIPVISQCISKLAGTIAGLNLELFYDGDRNNFITDDKRISLLNREPNEYMSAHELKYSIIEDVVLFGKSYVWIEKKGINIVGLWKLDFNSVSFIDTVDSKGRIISRDYNFTLNNKVRRVNSYEILEIKSGGKGLLHCDNLLKMFASHSEAVKAAMDNAAMPFGILKTDTRLTQTAIDRMRESWKNIYSGSSNKGKTIILEEGLSYNQVSIDISKIESIAHKDSFIADIERAVNLYDIKTNEDLLKYTLAPILNAFTSALNYQLLTTKEKSEKLIFSFNTDEIVKVSELEHMEIIKIGLESGIYSLGEARKALQMPAFLEDNKLDYLGLSMGKILMKSNGEMVLPNVAKSISLADGSLLTSPVPEIQQTKENIEYGKAV